MDYTNEPDCKLPLALIVDMPELKVKTITVRWNRAPNKSSHNFEYGSVEHKTFGSQSTNRCLATLINTH